MDIESSNYIYFMDIRSKEGVLTLPELGDQL